MRKMIRSDDQQCGRCNDVRRIGICRHRRELRNGVRRNGTCIFPCYLLHSYTCLTSDQTMFKRGRNCYTTLRQNFSVSRACLQNKNQHLTQHNNFTGIIFDVCRYPRDIFSIYITYILLHNILIYSCEV